MRKSIDNGRRSVERPELRCKVVPAEDGPRSSFVWLPVPPSSHIFAGVRLLDLVPPLEESRHSGISFFWPDIRRTWRPRPPLSSLCDFLRLVVGGRALWAARRAQQPCTSGQGLCAVCRLRRKSIHFAAVSYAPTLRGGGTRRHGVYLRLAPTRSRPAKQQSGRGTLVSISGATINRAGGSGAHASGAALGRLRSESPMQAKEHGS